MYASSPKALQPRCGFVASTQLGQRRQFFEYEGPVQPTGLANHDRLDVGPVARPPGERLENEEVLCAAGQEADFAEVKIARPVHAALLERDAAERNVDR